MQLQKPLFYEKVAADQYDLIFLTVFSRWAILSIMNLCMSIYGATTVESRSQQKQDTVLACVITTACVNIIAAYIRRDIDDTWFGCAFTTVLVLDSLLNFTTAARIMRTYASDRLELPKSMPQQVKAKTGGDVKSGEKSHW
ncbi:hypothetical protein C8R45DRAFT_1176986 [Mycena sanguinolenta]|nr:hypothetical protein C8R45DRAFT_1176986 [Mycena sanguinolenta]